MENLDPAHPLHPCSHELLKLHFAQSAQRSRSRGRYCFAISAFSARNVSPSPHPPTKVGGMDRLRKASLTTYEEVRETIKTTVARIREALKTQGSQAADRK